MLNRPDAGNEPLLEDNEAQAERLRRREAWRLASQVATVGMFVLLLGIVLSLARPVLLPVVSAIVIVAMLGPLARRAAALRVPPFLFACVVVGLIVGAIHFATIALSGPLARLIEHAPDLGPSVTSKLAVLDPVLTVVRHLQSTLGGGAGGVRIDVAAVLQATMAYLTPALGQLVIFLATLFLALVSRDSLRRNLILIFPDQDDRLAAIHILNDVEAKLNQYIGTVAAINFALGVVTALIAWAVGLPAPILFGFLAFVCNFVPYIGSGFTIISLLVTGLLIFPALTHALVAPALFLAIATIEGQLITPSLVGQRITISPLAVFLSLAFWIWLWGPIGGFLSVPLLIVGYAVLTHLAPKVSVELPG